MRVLFILFIIVPLVEMIVLIKVGGVIGALPTIALVCLTAAIGVALIRAQGLSAIQSAQRRMAAGEMPAKEIVDGICLAAGGALLLTPGFVTDTLGFVLLIPALRHLLLHRLVVKLMSGAKVYQSQYHKPESANATIEGEFRRHD